MTDQRRFVSRIAVLLLFISSMFATLPANAGVGANATAYGGGERCSVDAGGSWSCTYQQRIVTYNCAGLSVPRVVRWQVPVGKPPAGGWPVAFFFAGTKPNDSKHAFDRDRNERRGLGYEPQIMRELLDNPAQTGRRYAVVVADPPASYGVVQAWHTNMVFPYSASCDAQFFPTLFAQIKDGSFGAAGQFDLNRRYGFGVSSGGFNTSRMAVTFNSGVNASSWRALSIVAGSYATCSAVCPPIPDLPKNHPPTKFWHGRYDLIVSPLVMQLYAAKLARGGFVTETQLYDAEHEYTSAVLGSTGIKNWFDRY